MSDLLALVRGARRHLALLLVVSAALEAAVLVAIQYGPPKTGVLGWLQEYCHVLLPTYLFWVVLGGVAAVKLDWIRGWVDRHRGLVPVIVLGGAAATELWYVLSIHHGHSPSFAASVFQPSIVIWGAAAFICLFAAGRRWASRRVADSRVERMMRLG